MPTHWSDPANVIAAISVAVQLALVIAAILTLQAINRQTVRTAEAAEAALGSVRIQEAQLRQWFGVTNWIGQHRIRPDGGNELAYGLNITNPTDIPLDIRRITIHSASTRQDSAFAALFIPPKESYEINSSDRLNDDDLQHYKKEGLIRHYEITLEFTDPFHPEKTVTRTQMFLCAFRAGQGKVDVRLQPGRAPQQT